MRHDELRAMRAKCRQLLSPARSTNDDIHDPTKECTSLAEHSSIEQQFREQHPKKKKIKLEIFFSQLLLYNK